MGPEPLCNLTTLDLTPFLDLSMFTACVSTRVSPLCDPMFLADWEDLALELDNLLLLVDIQGVDVAKNLVIFLFSSFLKRCNVCLVGLRPELTDITWLLPGTGPTQTTQDKVIKFGFKMCALLGHKSYQK